MWLLVELFMRLSVGFFIGLISLNYLELSVGILRGSSLGYFWVVVFISYGVICYLSELELFFTMSMMLPIEIFSGLYENYELELIYYYLLAFYVFIMGISYMVIIRYFRGAISWYFYGTSLNFRMVIMGPLDFFF